MKKGCWYYETGSNDADAVQVTMQLTVHQDESNIIRPKRIWNVKMGNQITRKSEPNQTTLINAVQVTTQRGHHAERKIIERIYT